MTKGISRKQKLQKSYSDGVCTTIQCKLSIVTQLSPNVYLKHIYTYTKPLFRPHSDDSKQAGIQGLTAKTRQHKESSFLG